MQVDADGNNGHADGYAGSEHGDVEGVAARTERTWNPALASTAVFVSPAGRCHYRSGAWRSRRLGGGAAAVKAPRSFD